MMRRLLLFGAPVALCAVAYFVAQSHFAFQARGVGKLGPGAFVQKAVSVDAETFLDAGQPLRIVSTGGSERPQKLAAAFDIGRAEEWWRPSSEYNEQAAATTETVFSQE